MSGLHPGRVVLGGALVVVGVLFLLATMDVVDSVGAIIGRWWPLVLIAYGVLQFAADRATALGSAIIVGIGLLILGRTLGTFDSSIWRFLWPFALIALGIWVLAGRSQRSVGADGSVRAAAILGSRKVKVHPGPFRAGSVTVVLGSLELDLTETEPSGVAALSATVLLGSLAVLVPEGWRVEIEGTPIFGVWDDTTVQDGAGEQIVRVRALTVLGGVEARHEQRWG